METEEDVIRLCQRLVEIESTNPGIGEGYVAEDDERGKYAFPGKLRHHDRAPLLHLMAEKSSFLRELPLKKLPDISSPFPGYTDSAVGARASVSDRRNEKRR